MKNKRISKKIWIFVVFSVFIAVAMSFVSWLIYAVFAESYRDIKQQYYAVVSKQIVEDIENSVKNGKQIERFYGMDAVLTGMLDLVNTDSVSVQATITDASGNILYTSYGTDENKNLYNSIIAADAIKQNIIFTDSTASYKIVEDESYEFMLQPVYDKDKNQIGSMIVFYESAAIEDELAQQKSSSNFATLLCISGTIVVLLIYFLFIPRTISEDTDEELDGAERYEHKRKQNQLMFVVPVICIMAGLLVQCFFSYNEYQKKYKDVMFEGATGISEYIGSIIDELNNKGVPYEKMNGLAGYLAAKVEDSPLLWNVTIVNVYADTSSILTRDSEYNVSFPIGSDDDDTMNMHISVEISKEYIDNKMNDMLLVFIVAFAVALIMIYELLKLPDNLFTRLSRSFKNSKQDQVHSVAGTIRLGAFIAYTGLYIGIPFSSILITQWNQSLFGIPVTYIASFPMTAELLATMLCSLLFIPIYKRLNLKITFASSTIISLAANILCLFAVSPLELIILRFVSGIGFAGIKYTLNSIVSQGTMTKEDTTNNLAALNAGLLGGITCGASLGAVIASSVSVQTSYLIAGIFLFVFMVLVLLLSPWKLFAENASREAAEIKTSEKKSSALSFVFKWEFLRYVILVAIPLNIGLMFVVAFFPGFVTSLALPDVAISYGYLINGLIGIYIGPKLLSALSKRVGKTACVVVTLLIAAASMLILNISAPLVIVMVSVALLGLFDGFGTPASSDYYVNMPFVKKIGITQALAVLSVIGSIVQTFSPMLYSAVLDSGALGINIMGFAFLAAALLFFVSCKTVKMGEKKTDSITEQKEPALTAEKK